MSSVLGFVIKQLAGTTYDAFVTWGLPITGGAPVSYFVTLKTGISGPSVFLGTVYVTALLIHGLSVGIDYYLTITAVNGAGTGPGTTLLISNT